MRAKHFMFLLLAGLLVAPALLWSQGPPRNFGGKGGFDPDEMFNRISGGADVVRISTLDPRQQFMMKKMAEKAGVTGDEITRAQYKTGFQNADALLGGPKKRDGGPPGMFGRGPQGGDAQLDAEAQSYFATMDTNHDGFISHDEAQASQKLKDSAAFATFDTNKDGKLSFEEYKAFYHASKGAQQDPKHPAEDLEDQRPTIYRVGKLPKELPAWFGEIDKKGDNDGQVGMDEWVKHSSKQLDEFLTMDLNSDGVLTAEEYLKFHKHQQEVAKNDPLTTLAAEGEAGAIPGMGRMGPGGGGRMGPGGGGRMGPGGGGRMGPGGGGRMGPGGGGRPGGGWGGGGDGENPRQGRGGRRGGGGGE